jgi:uncharacterized membrane protein
MPTIECTEKIDAPVEEVFRRAIDLRNAPQWASQIKKIEVLTDGPIRKGTRFRETRVMFGREATEEMEVTSVNEPRDFTVECENHGCHYVTEFKFTPVGSGTEIKMKFGATARGFFARFMGVMMGPLMKGMMVKCINADLADLKKACEAQTASG